MRCSRGQNVFVSFGVQQLPHRNGYTHRLCFHLLDRHDESYDILFNSDNKKSLKEYLERSVSSLREDLASYGERLRVSVEEDRLIVSNPNRSRVGCSLQGRPDARYAGMRG